MIRSDALGFSFCPRRFHGVPPREGKKNERSDGRVQFISRPHFIASAAIHLLSSRSLQRFPPLRTPLDIVPTSCHFHGRSRPSRHYIRRMYTTKNETPKCPDAPFKFNTRLIFRVFIVAGQLLLRGGGGC